jgi:hypothetical protein
VPFRAGPFCVRRRRRKNYVQKMLHATDNTGFHLQKLSRDECGSGVKKEEILNSQPRCARGCEFRISSFFTPLPHSSRESFWRWKPVLSSTANAKRARSKRHPSVLRPLAKPTSAAHFVLVDLFFLSSPSVRERPSLSLGIITTARATIQRLTMLFALKGTLQSSVRSPNQLLPPILSWSI